MNLIMFVSMLYIEEYIFSLNETRSDMSGSGSGNSSISISKANRSAVFVVRVCIVLSQWQTLQIR